MDAARAQQVLEPALELARRAVGMELGYITEFTQGDQVYRAIAGDGDSFGMHVDDGYPLDGSYCQRMVLGDLPSVVTDAQADPAVRDLALTKLADIGAYVGVPIRFSDGRLFGTVCLADHGAQRDLGERDVAVLQVVARLLGAELERDSLVADRDAARAEADAARGERDRALEELEVARSTSLDGFEDVRTTELDDDDLERAAGGFATTSFHPVGLPDV